MKPDYGIDAPGVVRNFLIAGVVMIVAGALLPTIHAGSVTFALRPPALSIGISCMCSALFMLLYAKVGKFHHRDSMLARIDWKGNERVLDVGTGRGLLLIGAARKLTTGSAVGIDIWSARDLSGNAMENTYKNAEWEGVRQKVELHSEDATAMTFPDNSFDVVLSNLCLHNIPSRQGREQACREILRVLKPGGRAVISDFKNTWEYAKVFRAGGARVAELGMSFDAFPPLWTLQVDKP